MVRVSVDNVLRLCALNTYAVSLDRQVCIIAAERASARRDECSRRIHEPPGTRIWVKSPGE